MTTVRRLVLASASPRRRSLLEAGGFGHDAAAPGIDDAQLPVPREGAAHRWAAALSYLKARAASRKFFGDGAGVPSAVVLLSADTLVVKEGRVLGQPASDEEAARILALLEAGEHEVITGVTLLTQGRRRLLVDRARVRVGAIGRGRIDAYVASGSWRGKAGAYNLCERLEDGWPITYEGDPSTIMGLPMQILTPLLRRLLTQGDA